MTRRIGPIGRDERAARQCRDAWCQWLADRRYDWMVTLTFRCEPGADTAKKRVDHWLHRCNRAFFGRHWYRKGIAGLQSAFVLEIGREGRRHAHLLLARPDRALAANERDWMARIWMQRQGFAHWRPVERAEDAARYVTKSLGGDGVLHLGGKPRVMAAVTIRACQAENAVGG